MIHTPRRDPPPPELERNRVRWTRRWKELHTGRKGGDWATKKARQVLQGALAAITRGKCVYCESSLGVSSYPHIDHYVAKTLEPDRAFEWTNLLPACQKCNTAKGGQDHDGSLLKPDEEDPEPVFWINADSGELEPRAGLDEEQRRRALETIRLCKLQRGALCNERIRTIKRVGRWLRMQGQSSGAAVQRELDRLLNPATEYKLAVRHGFRGVPALAQEDRDRFQRRVP